MFRHHLIVAMRNLLKYKIYSVINLIGLSVGLTCGSLCLLFIEYEWSFDRFHKDADAIYLLRWEYLPSDGQKPSGYTPPILGLFLRQHFPEIQKVIRVFGWLTQGGVPVRYGDKTFYQSGFMVDAEFLDLFSFSFLFGNPNTALSDIHSVVISRQMADLYFGEQNPIGKQLDMKVNHRFDAYVVTGVVEVPDRSSLQFDFLVSYELMTMPANDWNAGNVYTYVQLRRGSDPAVLETKFQHFANAHFSGLSSLGGERPNKPPHPLRLMALRNVHLNSTMGEGLAEQTDPMRIYILTGIGLAMLLIVCVNAMNISLGLFSLRIQEVGIRKVMGASNTRLIKLFWTESFLLGFLSIGIILTLLEVIWPIFSRSLVQKELAIQYGIICIPLIFAVGILTLVVGIYPAVVCARFDPVEALQGQLEFGGKNRFGRSLVLAQFVISIFLLVSTLLMSEQMTFLRQQNLGFKKEQVVVIDTKTFFGLSLREKLRMVKVYRQAIQDHRDIVSVSMASVSFGRNFVPSASGVYNDQKISYLNFVVEYDYFKTLDISLLEGRAFSADFQSDRDHAILINEAMLKVLDWKSAIGKPFPVSHPQVPGVTNKTIIGICRDFSAQSLYQKVQPATFELQYGNGSLAFILVRIHPDNVPQTLTLLQDFWQQTVPNYPFVFSFLSEDVDRVFRKDERWVQIAQYSAILAILIACLGALGLTSLEVGKRIKEVGIRKVLGASTMDILFLFSNSFIKLLCVANLIAWPLGYYFIKWWLQDFAYRIDIGIGVFIVGSLLILVLILSTIFIRIFKVASGNPIKALRYE